ncbi:Crp/Fnr family transcriptional regulator [Mucilaginibacter mali]|uniref:Crp/Fnr family transcriptional regulator n=1 Tax=Mucilaginibacter mali TaxID=2740462 RepID=A0A7D4PRR4_9SPHI|nr:Crp/Fnr family transcriptional regulator [Mucilaginibacter mali]QKJ28408.1 Crp/Fnr family transcriptional regulator [Mucilaginibacter mali]
MNSAADFIHRLNRTKTLSLKLSNLLMEAFRINRFEAQETFLSPGNHASCIYFIESGLVRGAIEGPVEKLSTWFKRDGDIIVPHGLVNQQPSEEYISAVFKTTLIALPFKNLQKISETVPEAMELMILLMAETASELHYREKLLRIPTAKDRYSYLNANEDFILKRVPQYLVASYLNVTKETFSRLHKGLPY